MARGDQIAFSVQNNVQATAHIADGSADLNGTDVDWEIQIMVMKQGLAPGPGGEILFELDDVYSSVFSNVSAVDESGVAVPFSYTSAEVTADVGFVTGGTIITLSGTSSQSDGQLDLSAEFNNPTGGPGVSVFPFPALPYSVFNTDESEVFSAESASAVGGYSAFAPVEEVLRHSIPSDYAMPTRAWPSELAEGMQLPSLMIARKMVPGNQETVSNSSPGMFFCFDYRLTWYANDDESAVSAILFDPVTEQSLYFDNSNVDGNDTRLYHKIQIGSEDVVSHNYFMSMEYNGGAAC